jgi:hypothetical protein
MDDYGNLIITHQNYSHIFFMRLDTPWPVVAEHLHLLCVTLDAYGGFAGRDSCEHDV